MVIVFTVHSDALKEHQQKFWLWRKKGTGQKEAAMDSVYPKAYMLQAKLVLENSSENINSDISAY